MKYSLLKYLTKALLCLAMLGAVLVSCNDDDESGAVVLNSFGPSPVLRGNEIRFIGENLDRVTTVVIPNNIEVTDINVINVNEIRVTVPQEAEVGHVMLKFNGGVITTKTLLGFTEPYEITSIAPVGQSIRAGAEVTITGDYLNNIVKVVFSGDAAVDSADFVSQSRKEIKLTLPKEATSGKLYVEDAAGNQLYSDQELTVLQPAVTSLSATTIKPGQNLTITGSNFDLVSKVVFAGGTEVEAANFVSSSATQIVVATPANLQDGVVTLVAYSGAGIASPNLTTVMPTNLQITAETRFKTYLNVKITGTDLDLVNSVKFTGADAITGFTYQTGTITVAIPAKATDGVVNLSTQSGKSIATTSITLVKPVISGISPSPAKAGADMVITGSDLDLVTAVVFNSNLSVDVTPTDNSITVKVPVDAQSGTTALKLINGTMVTTSLTVVTPEFCYIPELPEGQIDAGTIFSVSVENIDKLTAIQVNGANTQYIVQGSTLYILVPGSANGTTELTLISSNGSVSYDIEVVGASTIETVIYEGPLSLTWSDGGRVIVPITAFEGVGEGSVLKIYFTQTDNWGQAQINNGNWTPISFGELNNNGYLTTDLYGDKSVSSQELVLTQDVLGNINNNASWGNALIIQGQEWIISKISIITSAVKAETIWEGSQDMGNWSAWLQVSSDKFANAKVGRTLVMYVTQGTVAAQYGIRDSNWANYIDYADIPSGATKIEIPIDQVLLDMMKAGGLIFAGHDYTLTKLVIK